MICHRGLRCINKRSAGSERASLKLSWRICVPCCGWPKGERKSHRQRSSIAGRCSRARKVGIEQATMERNDAKEARVHLAVDTLGHLLALHVTPANEQDRAQVGKLAAAVQEITGHSVELAFVDQGYTGDEPAQAAQEQGMRLEVIKLPQAKRGFVLLPRRWVVERSFAWMTRFRRLARDYER